MNGKQLAVSLGGMLIKVVLAIIIVVLLYKASLTCYDFGYRIFHDTAIDAEGGKEVTVAIVEGKSVKDIGNILKDKGLIRNAYLFVFQELFSGEHGKIKPGIYQLSTSMTPKEMIVAMTSDSVATDDTGSDTPADGTDTPAEGTDTPAADDDNTDTDTP